MRKISTSPALTKHIIHNDLLMSGSDEIKPGLVVLIIKIQHDWKQESAEEERYLLFQSNGSPQKSDFIVVTNSANNVGPTLRCEGIYL